MARKCDFLGTAVLKRENRKVGKTAWGDSLRAHSADMRK